MFSPFKDLMTTGVYNIAFGNTLREADSILFFFPAFSSGLKSLVMRQAFSSENSSLKCFNTFFETSGDRMITTLLSQYSGSFPCRADNR